MNLNNAITIRTNLEGQEREVIQYRGPSMEHAMAEVQRIKKEFENVVPATISASIYQREQQTHILFMLETIPPKEER